MKKTTQYSTEEWGEYIVGMLPVFARIASKCTNDEDLQQDCVQYAAMQMLRKRPEQCIHYESYASGDLSEKDWQRVLDVYIRECAKKKMLTLLQSVTQGNQYVGRMVPRIDPLTGDRVKVYRPPVSSFEDLSENFGLDIDETGEATWSKTNGWPEDNGE